MSQPPPPPPGPPPQSGPDEPEGPQQPPGPPPQQPAPDKQQGGGYGYPQAPAQPPQPGGYGYPQPPAQPPQGGFGGPQAGPVPGPYGQPQPGPYGQPQPYGPGPYGQPQPGPYGYPGGAPTVPPGGRPPGGDNKVLVIVAAVVAVLLVVGGGVWFLAQDGGGSPDPQASSGGTTSGSTGGGGTDTGGGDAPTGTDGELLFTVDAPDVNESTGVPGAWATDEFFVKSSIGKILAVRAADGSSAWEIPLDGPVCAASPHRSEDGRTAVVTRESGAENADCNQMVVLDLDKGKKAWQKTIPGDADVSSLGGGVTVARNTVAAAWIGGAVAYSLDGGSPLWGGDWSGECRDEGYAGGAELVAVVRCGNLSDPEYRVQTLNPKNGKPVGEYTVPSGISSVHVLSTAPLVIGVGAGEYHTTDIITVGDDHQLESKITLGDRYEDPCRTDTESCWTSAVSDDYVFLPTKSHDSSGDAIGQTNSVMAFDIHSGATKWKVDAGDGREILPFDVQDGKLLAYRTATYEDGGEIVEVDPASHQEKLRLRLPSGHDLDYEREMGPRTYGSYSRVIFRNGRLFFHQHITSDRVGTYTKERLLAVGYGAG
ncbi:PQQ-binding-like beta-propeller repeat protein [Streptomyces sp. TR02-1]|uniref:outer membrane protein assembly factor BamB family protein n=1 Tax=Streptomyces sp. TR02-1 TaxID=3385977 RepID=UPI0039A10827